MKRNDDHTYQLTLTVRDRPGVLVRCAQVLGRRNHVIEALQMTELSEQPDAARMTITAFGQPSAIQQIIAQLTKLVDVLNVTESEL